MNRTTLGLFEAFGIELEYMIVDLKTMRPRSIAEQMLLDENGESTNEISIGNIDISNELATHVLEFKSSVPTADLDTFQADLQSAIQEMNRRLAIHGAILAPGGIHPLMDPKTEGKLWSKGDRTIYAAYNRIFDCRGHGWYNLQSCHLNLPFANEKEFGQLHAAVILLLPFLPALSASSPFIEGKHLDYLDTRLDVYAKNQVRIPQIAGNIVPEPAFTYAEYESMILQPMYKAIAPQDPEKLLQHEWLNSRGAIARFDRNAIEIRVLDTQENPSHDLAICCLIIAILEHLCSLPVDELQRIARSITPAERKEQFIAVAKDGFDADLKIRDLADIFNLSAKADTVGELWRHILDTLQSSPRLHGRLEALELIIGEGNLAERLLRTCGKSPSTEQIESEIANLARCLDQFDSYLEKSVV